MSGYKGNQVAVLVEIRQLVFRARLIKFYNAFLGSLIITGTIFTGLVLIIGPERLGFDWFLGLGAFICGIILPYSKLHVVSEETQKVVAAYCALGDVLSKAVDRSSMISFGRCKLFEIAGQIIGMEEIGGYMLEKEKHHLKELRKKFQTTYDALVFFDLITSDKSQFFAKV